MRMIKLSSIFFLLLIYSQSVFSQSTVSIDNSDCFFNKKNIKSDKKFTFAIIGDKSGGGLMNWPVFDRAVDEINLLRPDFAIMIGDMIQGTVSDVDHINRMYKAFKSHSDRLEVPLLVIPGNHDISNEVMFDYWVENIGDRYFSFVKDNTLFLLLNTEEYRKTGDGYLGHKQLKFVKKELKKHKNVDQTFIFLHRPIWLKEWGGKDGTKEWGEIASIIKDRNATIVAGHSHHLSFQKIDGHKYLIHGATGGGLDEQELPDLGGFHHYSMVNVYKDSAQISIIKPGNIYKVDVAKYQFIRNIDSIVKFKSYVDYNDKNGELVAKEKFQLENKLDRTVEVDISIKLPTETKWKLNEKNYHVVLKSGEKKNFTFEALNNLKNSIPFPQSEYTVKIGNDIVKEGKTYFVPGNEVGWRYLDEVEILGAFHLGTTDLPTTEAAVNKIPLFTNNWAQDDAFMKEQLKNNFEWKKLKVEGSKINGDYYFSDRNFSAAFVKFNIYSAKDKLVLASIMPDNYCKVYVNGEAVIDGEPLKPVPEDGPYVFTMSLKKGNNTIIMKMADFYGGWYTRFKVADPNSLLKFGIVK